MSDDRSRVFAFEMYKESAPEGWQQTLEKMKIPTAISPLHDKDVWTDADQAKNPDHVAGSPKKAHWHCTFYFDAKKSVKQVLNYLKPFGIKYVEVIGNTRSHNRYMLHLDQPEKAQYNREDVICLNGARPDFSIPLSSEDIARIRFEIIEWVQENSITEYAELVVYAAKHRPDDWIEYVANHTIFLNGFITSKRYIEKWKRDL